MPKVNFIASGGGEKSVDVEPGENAMRAALYNGVEGIVGECGGGLACATCHVYVDPAWTERAGGPSSQAERDMLGSAVCEVRPESRLSCQIEMHDGLDGQVKNQPERQF
jgi:2Fe-2S ferredoxin